MRQVMAIILRELLILKRKFWRYAFSFSISPLLYMITFGWAARGRLVNNGVDYMTFMLPGLIAMSSMMNSFAMSSEINIARFYWKTFDEIRSAPVSDLAYASGEVLSGMLRGGVAAGVVIVLGMLFHVPIHILFSCSGRRCCPDDLHFCLTGNLHGNADEVPCGSSNAVELCHHTDGLSLRHFLSGGSLSGMDWNPCKPAAVDSGR